MANSTVPLNLDPRKPFVSLANKSVQIAQYGDLEFCVREIQFNPHVVFSCVRSEIVFFHAETLEFHGYTAWVDSNDSLVWLRHFLDLLA